MISGDSSSDGLGTAGNRGAYLGLISSTFSTVVSQLSAATIGSDALADWMSHLHPGTRLGFDRGTTIGAIAIGIA